MAIHSSILNPKNPMDRGAWQATVHGIAEELDTTEHTDLSWAVTSFKGNNVCKVRT